MEQADVACHLILAPTLYSAMALGMLFIFSTPQFFIYKMGKQDNYLLGFFLGLHEIIPVTHVAQGTWHIMNNKNHELLNWLLLFLLHIVAILAEMSSET